MCKFKSGIILKDQVFVPDYDSHTYMLKELGIEDNEINAKTLFVRAELSPINDNIFSDISTWQFNVDQDILPDWFVYDYDKKRMVNAVKEWKNNHIFENVDNLELKGNDTYHLKNCRNVKAYDSCKVIAYRNCTVYTYDNCIVNVYDNCTVNAFNDCVVTVHGNCRVYAYDDCTVYTHNNCTTYAFNKCTVYAQDTSRIVAHDDCTVNAHDESIVTIYDDCKVYAHHNSIITSIDGKPHDKNLKLFNNAIFINKATQTIFYRNENYKFVKIEKNEELGKR